MVYAEIVYFTAQKNLVETKIKPNKMKQAEKIKLEIRAAEGGEDAKLLVNEMADIYKKAANINSFDLTIEH